jgi:hypothetical protein
MINIPLSCPTKSGEITVFSITPLYCLVTDADQIDFGDELIVTRFSEGLVAFLGNDDDFMRRVHLYKPQGLLWERKGVSFDEGELLIQEVIRIKACARELHENIWVGQREEAPKIRSLADSLRLTLRSFQLYKRGRLVVGDSLFYVPAVMEVIVRCSEMHPDYLIAEHYRPLYEFNSTEVRDFISFQLRFLKASLKTIEYPEIELALNKYCEETARHGDPIGLMTALECLLVPEEEGIKFKLSQRVANLLGTDAKARKELFKKVGSFYNLRSKIVHGAQVRAKDLDVQQQLDELREITRKVILSVVALAADSGMGPEFPALLNDMCFDDDVRRTTQEKASSLLR